MMARQGVTVVAVSMAAGIVSSYYGAIYPAAIFFGLSALLIWFHHVPRRRAPAAPLGLLSPVDGRVVRVEQYEDPWLKRPALRISVKVTPPGITVFFCAMEGKVHAFWTSFGPFGEGRLKRSLSASPDCYAVHVQSDEGEDVVMAVSSRWPLSRCRFDRSPGERVGQGAQFGFVYFASSFELLAPVGARALVASGDRVRAVESLLAELQEA